MAAPECPLFGTCGGCTAQHIEYERQVENKLKRLSAIAGVEAKPFTASPYSYRNRMDFVFHPAGLGLREKGNWRSVVDVERCPISSPGVNALLAEARAAFLGADSFDQKRNSGTFKYAVARVGTEAGDMTPTSLTLVLNSDSSGYGAAVERIKAFSQGASASTVMVAPVSGRSDISATDDAFCVKGDGMLSAAYLGRRFLYPCQGFFQNNHAVAELMHTHVRGLLTSWRTGGHLLDLYAGVGTFGIINSDLFSDVALVESAPASVAAAERNIAENSARNVRSFRLDASQLGRLKHLQEPLTAISDPPRSGMEPKALLQLLTLRPEKVIYISCNPERLSSDIGRFTRYEVESAALFDMFPQTNHIEAVVGLSLKG